MNYEIINSGSDGNCIIVNKVFMLDCGISYSKIKKYLKNIKLIFISHSHTDHLNTATIKQIAYNYPNIKYVVGSKDLLEKMLTVCWIKPSNIFALPSGKWFNLGLLNLKLESIEHDVPNHLCKFQIKDKKGIYIVDAGNVNNVVAKDYDLYLIEANYMDNVLERHKLELDENGEFNHLHRVENVHLSYAQANNFLIENMKKDSVFEYIHRSDYNFIESEMV